ncbi:DUF3775 domain-containing protein [Halotia branconii]|uniref:DUF3775 domain-containing protein n=1 Tax=Halotia branconii CENA392 TaxID=1539056 RepID=A0AAJ6NZ29_9CYAN|nr:DUF3775 domain-containing protein [Halotia branconii]WGV29123.1 DUF3775 domain-containing protein [Halotia branconii CENA392]
MNFLKVDQVQKIIELAELAYCSKDFTSEEIADSKTQAKELVEFLIERRTPNTPLNTLYEYVNQLSAEEKAELIALMLLGRGHSGEQPSDFPDLVKEAQGMEAHYLLEKSLLAKYLRNGLQKLNLPGINQ